MTKSREVTLPQLQAALEDRYRIEREIGSGGMATVYLARDVKHDRDVALKILRPELSAIVGAERFLNEIRITARLDHPHILTLIDSGASKGFLYYVLPFVRGESLRDRLRRESQLSIDDAIAITRQIGSALEYAHRQGVVHRDVKPENILLHEGEAMLTDFGIALAVRQAGGNRLTESGLSLGTPQYMSPEQATGDRDIDARGDEYSLAAVLYEMLVGEVPHTGPSVQAIIAKLLTQRPVRLRTLRGTVPEPIDSAVDKALAKLPSDRFPTVGEFVRAVSVGEGLKAQTGFAWTPRRIAVAAAITGLIVTALVVSTVAFRRGHDGGVVMLAVLPFDNQGPSAEEYFADGLADAITNRLASVRTLGVIAERSARQYKHSSKPLSEIGRELGVQYVVQGTVRWQSDALGQRKVQISTSLVQVSDGTVKWAAEPYVVVPSDIFGVQSDVATRVASALDVALAPPRARGAEDRPTRAMESFPRKPGHANPAF